MREIVITRYPIFAKHGVYEVERKLGQTFYVSLNACMSEDNTFLEDSLEVTVDYLELCDVIKKVSNKKIYDTLEKFAEHISIQILKEYPEIESVCVEIFKPYVAVPNTNNCFSVKNSRKRHNVCLAFGSNIEPCRSYIEFAIKKIRECDFFSNIKVSQFYVTEPEGGIEQEKYINACVSCKSIFTPNELLCFAQKLEKEAGRIRQLRWGPRTLDVDILLIDDLKINQENLCVPHPEMQNRMFVLKPLLEIEPRAYNPKTGLNIEEMFNKLYNDKNGEIIHDRIFDDMTPIEKYLFLKNQYCEDQQIDHILLVLYCLRKKFSGNVSKGYIYILDDQSVFYVLNKVYPKYKDYDTFLKKMLVLDCAKLIYRFTCALKFDVNDFGKKQLRINSWGEKYVDEQKEMFMVECRKIEKVVEKVYIENEKKYSVLINLLQSSELDVPQIAQLNQSLKCKLLS